MAFFNNSERMMLVDTMVIIEETKQWIENFVIHLNLCPFAQREIHRNSVRFHVSQAENNQTALQDFHQELLLLNSTQEIETSFLIFPGLFIDFYDYLDFVDLAEDSLIENSYEGIYQLASFHPEYCFDETPTNDPANSSNRSPYAMLHILREASVEKAVQYYGDTEEIPQKNIQCLRQLGLEKINMLRRTKTE